MDERVARSPEPTPKSVYSSPLHAGGPDRKIVPETDASLRYTSTLVGLSSLPDCSFSHDTLHHCVGKRETRLAAAEINDGEDNRVPCTELELGLGLELLKQRWGTWCLVH